MLVAALFQLVVAAPAEVTVTPSEVPARGAAQAVVRVGAPGMYRLVVDSQVGTACTLVDHLRGPFHAAGVVGSSSCATDVLLDAGVYKLRLSSPSGGDKSPPSARLRVAAFTDVDAVRVMNPGDRSVMPLPEGRSLARAIEVKGTARREVVIDVVGRTAGVVKLWRDGRFVEDVRVRTEVVRGEAGRPRFHHRISEVLDPGLYVVVAYGSGAQAFTTGDNDDTVAIFYDAALLPRSLGETITLPPWGFVELAAPHGEVAVLVDRARDQPPQAKSANLTVEVVSRHVVGDVLTRDGRGASCVAGAGAGDRSCAIVHGDAKAESSVVVLRGAAGAAARVQVVPTGGSLARFSARASAVEVELTSPADTLDVITFPPSADDAPLGCALERLDEVAGKGRVASLLATDLPTVGWTKPYLRRINVGGTSTAVWLRVERAGLYHVSSTDRGASCDVFTVDAGGERTRVGGSSRRCDDRLALPQGLVEVRLSGGRPGIDTVRVGQVGLSALSGEVTAPARAGCRFGASGDGGRISGQLPPGRYRVRLSGESPRVAGVLGQHDGAALRLVDVSPERDVVVRVAEGEAGQAGVTVVGDGVSCVLVPAAPGAELVPLKGCRVAAVRGEVTLQLRAPTPVVAAVVRDDPAPSVAELAPLTGAPPALPIISAGERRGVDLDGDVKKSFLVRVPSAGLYRIETDGLLHTSCAVRTATSATLFASDGTGRGRNCRVEAFLKPAEYRVDVGAQGRSRGRAIVALTKVDVTDGGPLVAGDERFVQVPAGVPAAHRITTSEAMTATLAVTAQEGALRCRLDDDDGWPLLAPPHDCSLTVPLEAGRYTLTVLPHSVESRRSLSLNVPQPSRELRGTQVHTVALNTRYRASLSADGSDAFRFTVGGDVEVGVVLGDGMLARLRRVNGKVVEPEVLELIAPRGVSGFGVAGADGDGGDGDGGGEPDDEPSSDGDGEGGDEEGYAEGGEGEGEGGGSEGEGEGEYTRAESPPSTRGADLMRAATVPTPPPPLAGQQVRLSAGTYELTTEHARGDVGISYDVEVQVRELVVGAAVAVTAPAVIDVVAPPKAAMGELSLVRVRTRGPTDVACRLIDEHGVVIAAAQSSGSDWNCALAAPLTPAARYRLLVDAEELRPGPVTVSAELLPAKSTGALKDKDSFRVIGKVARADVRVADGEVADVELVAKEGEFSCAVFESDGRVVSRHVGVTRCPLLLWGAGKTEPFSVLLWSENRPASVSASLRTRAVRGASALGADVLEDDVVREAPIPARGRFDTAPNLWCLPKATRGALVPCGGGKSLDPATDGSALLMATLRGQKARTSLAELTAPLGPATARELRAITATHEAERQRSTEPALHLVDVRARPGADQQPACGLGATSLVRRERDRCVAVSEPTKESLLALWTRPGAATTVTLLRRAVPVPSATSGPAPTSITTTARLALPDAPARVVVGVSADATVVLLDKDGRPRSLCPGAVGPGRDGRALARCRAEANGGSVVVIPADGRATPTDLALDVVTFERLPRHGQLIDRIERAARAAGQERLVVGPATNRQTTRLVRAEGPAVLGCVAHFDDGQSASGCAHTVEPGRAVELVVDHRAGAWRAFVAERGRVLSGRYGAVRANGPALAPRVAVTLGGDAEVARRVTVDTDTALRVQADSGVCAVAGADRLMAASGSGDGCDMQLVVPRGTYVIAVRPFDNHPLRGALWYQTLAVPTLGEGVGAEVLALPGDARFFRVDFTRGGKLGVGVAVDADVLDCTLLSDRGEVVAEGCQLFGTFTRGTYLLKIAVTGTDQRPRRFKPVVFGTRGADVDVPDDYLADFFSRLQASEVR